MDQIRPHQPRGNAPTPTAATTGTVSDALADAAARLIAQGEKPAPFLSPRDGRALRLVPPGQRLRQSDLAAALAGAMARRAAMRLEAEVRLPPAAGGVGRVRKARASSNGSQAANGTRPNCRVAGHKSTAGPEAGLTGRHPGGPHVPGRALLSWLRGWAYLEAGIAAQALKDARAAVAYTAPALKRAAAAAAEVGTAPVSAIDAASAGITGGVRGVDGYESEWPAALLLLAEAQSAAGEPPEEVVLSLLRAQLSLSALGTERGPVGEPVAPPPHPADTAPGVDAGEDDRREGKREDPAAAAPAVRLRRALEVAVREALEAAVARLSEESWAAFREGGEQGLRQLLAQRAEARLPEFLRPRPRWHYYTEWMRQRITAVCPGLPEPVVSKLLRDTDANDLDLMLQHPLAVMAQAEEYSRVLTLYGESGLLSYKAEPLGWDEMQAMAGGALVGLPIGYDAAIHAPRHYGGGAAAAITAGSSAASVAATAPTAAAEGAGRLTAMACAGADAAGAGLRADAEGADGNDDALGGEESKAAAATAHRVEAGVASNRLNPLVGPGAGATARYCLALALEALQGGGRHPAPPGARLCGGEPSSDRHRADEGPGSQVAARGPRGGGSSEGAPGGSGDAGGDGGAEGGSGESGRPPQPPLRRRDLVLRAASLAAELAGAVRHPDGDPEAGMVGRGASPLPAATGAGAASAPQRAPAAVPHSQSPADKLAGASAQLPSDAPQSEGPGDAPSTAPADHTPPLQPPPPLSVLSGSSGSAPPSVRFSDPFDLWALD